MTDHIPNDLSHLSEEEFNPLCPQGEHAPGPAPLSPAAQAVLDALHTNNSTGPERFWARANAAAALRAAADQVVPEHANPVGDEHDDARHEQWMRIRAELLAIADELEASR